MDLDVRTEGTTIRQFVGYMPEYDCLPPDTSATDFVTHMARMSGLPSTAARERTAEVLRHVGLYEERYRAIGGYSTGMKQRVKLAQALVHDPRLLLLDEPTNGLDPAGRDEMLALVRRTGTEFGIAVVVASHLLGEIERVCDFLVAIDAGRLLRAAPLGAFTERTGVLAVEVEEGEAALTAALIARGLQAVADGRTVLLNDHRGPPVRPRPRRGRRPRACRSSGWSSAARASRTCSVTTSRAATATTAAGRTGRRGSVGMTASGPGGSIYDLGYQSYTGPRLGRRSAVRALFSRFDPGVLRDRPRRPGQDRAVHPGRHRGPAGHPGGRDRGDRRPGRTGGGAIEDASPIRYETYHGLVSILIMLFCAAQAPELFGRDQRYGVLPLYFSRVLTRPDYALAKVLGLMVALFAVAVDPVSHPVRRSRLRGAGSGDGPRRRDRRGPEVPAPGRCSSPACSAASPSLIAAWTPRRAYATAAIIAVFIIPPIIVAIIAAQTSQDLARVDHPVQPGRRPRWHERGDLRVDPGQHRRRPGRPAGLGIPGGRGDRHRRDRSA